MERGLRAEQVLQSIVAGTKKVFAHCSKHSGGDAGRTAVPDDAWDPFDISRAPARAQALAERGNVRHKQTAPAGLRAGGCSQRAARSRDRARPAQSPAARV